MAARLTLSTVGIKSPLDVQELTSDAPSSTEEPAAAVTAARPARPARRRTARAPRSQSAAERSGGEAPFYGSGRPLQTSIALDADCAQLLEELARAAHVTLNALAVAALQAGLPPHSDGARAAIVDERVRRAGVSVARIERNVRLPEQLRARIDELVAAARERLPRVNRADLVNAALRDGLPPDAEHAATLVCEYARRLERAAAA
jgi:Arc/MetJ-type ribon-helix-helix transcriptional regulator/predicted transcriptional regulator